MRMPVRRALVAATVSALALPSGASASCVPHCGEVVYAATETVRCLPVCMDELYRLMNRLLDERPGDASGTYCAYAKLSGGPPPGWAGGGGPPYVWVETKAWGDENPDEHHVQVCVPGCEVDNSPMPGWGVPDLSGSSARIVKEAQRCATTLR